MQDLKFYPGMPDQYTLTQLTKRVNDVENTAVFSINGAPPDASGNVTIAGGGSVTIADNLTTNSSTSVLSAAQGVVLKSQVDGKQATLVSGSTIKTINGTSLLGSGDIVISGGGSGATNLTATASATTVVIASDTGTDATIAAADGVNAGLMLPAQFTKLAGVATGATANSTDAQLRDRSTHTGAQAISTVTGLQTALDAKAPTASPSFTGAVTLAGPMVTTASAMAGTVIDTTKGLNTSPLLLTLL